MANEHNLIDGSTNRIDFNLNSGIKIKACPNGTVQITDDKGNGIQIATGGAVTVIGGGSFPSAPVTSVFGRTGAVAAQTGDYAVANVTGAAPTASPALTGNPTAPTQAPLSNDTKIATDAYTDAAVAVETTRATTAEALLAPKASPTFTGTVVLPTNETIPAAGQLISPASGSSVIIAVPFGDSLTIDDGGIAGHTNEDSILIGPASVGGASGGISMTGCLGAQFALDPGGTSGFNAATVILMETTGNVQELITIACNNGNGGQFALTHTAFQLSGAGGQPNVSGDSATGKLRLGPYTLLQLDNTVTSYNGMTTVDGGVPSEVGHADLTAQSAAKAATTLVTPITTGRFRICAYLKVTTPATTSSILGGVTITFTDGTDSVAQSVVMQMQSKAGLSETSDAGNVTTTILSGELFIFAKTGVAIQYAIAYTSVGGTAMQYEAHLTAERM